jgi:chemotaxis protein MotB
VPKSSEIAAVAKPRIIIRKVKGHGGGHHGGSWKVAFADFMTAMMAFFLLLWVLETATQKELMAIAGYFQAPGDKYVVGPGGADAAVIDMRAPMEDSPVMETGEPTPLDGGGILGDDSRPIPQETEAEEEELPADEEESEKLLEQIEQAQLGELEERLEAEINKLDSALNKLKDQIHMEETDLGLSIQIVDKERHTMFSEGSAQLLDHAQEALLELAPIIDKVPNKISVVGHTDATPYGPNAVYTNWELSADRANSARRALLQGSFPEAKVIAVQGMGAISPLLPEAPTDPANRRIAIIVLKKAVSDAMMQNDSVPDLGALPKTPSIEIDNPKRVMTEEEIQEAIEREKTGKK